MEMIRKVVWYLFITLFCVWFVAMLVLQRSSWDVKIPLLGTYAQSAWGDRTGGFFVLHPEHTEWQSAFLYDQTSEFITHQIISYHYNEEDVLLVATDKGVLGSRNHGVNWSVAYPDTQTHSEAFAVVVIPAVQTVFIATRDEDGYGVVLRSIDGGESFEAVYASLMGEDVIVSLQFDADAEVLYGLSRQGYVIKSGDLGATWQQYIVAQQGGFFQYEIHPHIPSVMFAVSQQGLYTSSDSAVTWRRLLSFSAKTIYSMSIDKAMGDVFLGTQDSVLYSRDNGESFDTVSLFAGMVETPIRALFVASQDKQSLFVGRGSVLYHTDDLGATWSVRRVPGAKHFLTHIIHHPVTQRTVVSSQKFI